MPCCARRALQPSVWSCSPTRAPRRRTFGGALRLTALKVLFQEPPPAASSHHALWGVLSLFVAYGPGAQLGGAGCADVSDSGDHSLLVVLLPEHRHGGCAHLMYERYCPALCDLLLLLFSSRVACNMDNLTVPVYPVQEYTCGSRRAFSSWR